MGFPHCLGSQGTGLELFSTTADPLDSQRGLSKGQGPSPDAQEQGLGGVSPVPRRWAQESTALKKTSKGGFSSGPLQGAPDPL